MSHHRIASLKVLCVVSALLISPTLLAENFTRPTNVRIDGATLLWDPVEDAGGYNIYREFGYLTTVRNRTQFEMQVDGFYQVIAFDEGAARFSRPSEGVSYEAGSPPSISADINSYVNVVSITCQNVAAGETCAVSCGGASEFNVATGGACSTSDIVEADATAGPTSYSCTVPTFSGEVRAQVYCLSSRAFR